MTALAYVTDPSVSKSGRVVEGGPLEESPRRGGGTSQRRDRDRPRVQRHGARDALGAVVTVSLASGRVFRVRAGGITGDFLGAAPQGSECAMLLALAIVRGSGW